MKSLTTLTCLFPLFCGVVFAQSPVTIKIYPSSHPETIPQDFLGLSFETAALIKNNAGVNGYFFSPADTQLVTLFRNLGIRNLRIGGDSVDTTATPSHQAIDSLFGFAKSVNVKVIYSLRLANGDSVQDASTAKFTWDNYRPQLQCFAIGNEPNLYGKMDPEITGYSTWLSEWQRFESVVVDSVPNAVFGGPDVGTGGWSWDPQFAQAESGSAALRYIFSHYYVGGVSTGKTAQQLIDNMLSMKWDTTNYPKQYAKISTVGLPYRLTESNCYVAGNPGVWGGNNSFATALFALDYARWWSMHDCTGVNFHTYQWKYNGTIYPDSIGDLEVYPIAYGIKAFEEGGYGLIDSVATSNPNGLDLTAYAVTDTDHTLFVTIINKEHGTAARDANVTIRAVGVTDSVMYLEAPNNNAGATSDITLGGSSITDSGPWQGRYTVVDSASASGCLVTVPASSAAIVKIVDAISSVSQRPIRPLRFYLSQNYPNPFNPTTKIEFTVAKRGMTTLVVYNVLGQKVATLFSGNAQPGERYLIDFDGSMFASGIYFSVLQNDGERQIHKMALLK